jgi:hypothetical protein
VADNTGVSILLGHGDGTFQAAQSYPSGNNPFSVAVGDFNGDGFPDLAVSSGINSGGGVTVLLNAADWGRGPAPAPSGRPALHRPIPSRLQGDPVATLLVASKSQAEHPFPLAFNDLPPNHVGQWPVETETGQPAHSKATFAPTAIGTVRHIQDTVFEQWDDGVLDVLACNIGQHFRSFLYQRGRFSSSGNAFMVSGR